MFGNEAQSGAAAMSLSKSTAFPESASIHAADNVIRRRRLGFLARALNIEAISASCSALQLQSMSIK
jgi:hypothetical protein